MTHSSQPVRPVRIEPLKTFLFMCAFAFTIAFAALLLVGLYYVVFPDSIHGEPAGLFVAIGASGLMYMAVLTVPFKPVAIS